MKPIALITGSSGGIGTGIARKLVSDGYAVVLHCNAHEDIVCDTVRSFPEGTDYLIVSCNLTDACQTQEMIDRIHSSFGKVSLLVNCAGTALPQMLFSDTTDEDIETVFRVNVTALMRVTRLLLGDIRSNTGSIVNVSSMWGITGASCEVIYSASKSAVIGFTKALAKEMAPSGVRVNAVAPGFVPTGMNAHLSERDAETFREDTPLERFGTPEDVANAVSYLAQAEFVTGQVLSVDGGIVI